MTLRVLDLRLADIRGYYAIEVLREGNGDLPAPSCAVPRERTIGRCIGKVGEQLSGIPWSEPRVLRGLRGEIVACRHPSNRVWMEIAALSGKHEAKNVALVPRLGEAFHTLGYASR